MKQVLAIVINQGGKICYVVIIVWEMGILVIVGCGDVIDIIKIGEDVIICCFEGDEGLVYSGILNYEVYEMELFNLFCIKI